MIIKRKKVALLYDIHPDSNDGERNEVYLEESTTPRRERRGNLQGGLSCRLGLRRVLFP